MDRLEQLRQVIDMIIRRNPDPEEARCGFVHLYGVSAICAMLAHKRGLDPQICSTAGMLHDIWSYQAGDYTNHGQLGAVEAEKILTSLGSFSLEEIRVICEAIARHSDKETIDGEMAELLKDADVFQHFLYNPGLFTTTRIQQYDQSSTKPMRIQRLEKVLSELGIPTI